MNQLKEIRLAGSEALGKSISQKEASALVGQSERTWYMWESGQREINQAALELFCLKTGLKYHPDMAYSKQTIKKLPKKIYPSVVPVTSQNLNSTTQFLTLRSAEDNMLINLNANLIESYKSNKKTGGTEIRLATGRKIEVVQAAGEISEILNPLSALDA